MDFLPFIKENAPCYIYDGKQITEQCRKLKKMLPSFTFLYSIKTNPFPLVLKSVALEGFGADAASLHEVEKSLESGMKPEQIFYSAPGKTILEMEKCYGKCVPTADSLHEIEYFNTIAKKHNEVLKIGVRINPDFGMNGGPGCAGKFGIDMEQAKDIEALLKKCENVKINGIHIHVKSQILDHEVIGNYHKRVFELAKRLNELENVNIEFINFGSGIGTNYDGSDKSVDLQKLAEMSKEIVEENEKTLKAKLYIETGRFIVCQAGTYYTKIVDIKVSHGKKFLIVQNGMNGFLRPAIAALLNKVAGSNEISGQEPLYTSNPEFEVKVLNESTKKEKVDVVGNLCTALDVIQENVVLNYAEIGDIVSISNAGSYAYSLSPLLFSSHDIPQQFFIQENGEIVA